MVDFTVAQQNRLRYSSFVVSNTRLLFVETPKVACTSFKHAITALDGQNFKEFSYSLMSTKTGALGVHDRGINRVPSLLDYPNYRVAEILTSKEYLRFCAVRNPFSRLASSWIDKILCHSLSLNSPLVEALGFPEYRDNLHYLQYQFSEFVNYLYNAEAPAFSNHHWQTMTELLLPELIDYSLVIRVEELTEYVGTLISHVESYGQVWPGLPWFNESLLSMGSELYTQHSSRRVAEMYECDFARYGYCHKSAAILKRTHKLPEKQFVRSIQERNRRISYLSLRARGAI